MLTRERVTTLAKLAFPMCVALSSTLTMALIDLVMVRPFGNDAVAAVGLSVFSHSLAVAFTVGIAPAVQGLVARRRGQGSTEPGCLPLNGGLLVALIAGVPLTIVCWLGTPFFFSLISSDSGVAKIGIPFLRTLYTALIATGMLSALRGHWNGMEMPAVHMWIVVGLNGLKFLGNYVLIPGRFGAPAMGVTGAAVSTALALYLAVAVNGVMTWARFRNDGFLKIVPPWSLVKRIVKMGLPPNLQEFFFAAGYVAFLWMVGQVGTAELAAANVLVRITMLLALLAMSLGMASATLVSRTVGEGDLAGAAQWGWDAVKLGVIAITLLGLPLFLFPEQSLSLFLSDPRTISMAIIPLRIVAATTGIGSLIYILAYTLYSVGDGNRVALLSLSTQWFLFLPAVWIVGPYLKYGLLQIWLLQLAYGAVVTAWIVAIWAQGRWKTINI